MKSHKSYHGKLTGTEGELLLKPNGGNSSHTRFSENHFVPSPIRQATPQRNLMKSHKSYHGKITGTEAELLLKRNGGNCYLTRFSENHERYILSVMIMGNLMHYEIHIDNIEKKYGIDETDNEFNTVNEMLTFYESNPLSPGIENIGRCCLSEEARENLRKQEHELELGKLQQEHFQELCKHSQELDENQMIIADQKKKIGRSEKKVGRTRNVNKSASRKTSIPKKMHYIIIVNFYSS